MLRNGVDSQVRERPRQLFVFPAEKNDSAASRDSEKQGVRPLSYPQNLIFSLLRHPQGIDWARLQLSREDYRVSADAQKKKEGG